MMSFLPNLIYRCNTIPINISVSYILDINKLSLKFVWEDRRLKRGTFDLKCGLCIVSFLQRVHSTAREKQEIKCIVAKRDKLHFKEGTTINQIMIRLTDSMYL